MTTNTKAEQNDDEEWRRLCEAVSHEPDPQRLSILVDQLIKKLDARAAALRTLRGAQESPLGGSESPSR